MRMKVISGSYAWQLRQVAAGRCKSCGKPREKCRADRTLCQACGDRHTERYMARARRLIAEGRCEACGHDREPERANRRRCSVCARKMTDYARERAKRSSGPKETA